jgi:hypothetical protein
MLWHKGYIGLNRGGIMKRLRILRFKPVPFFEDFGEVKVLDLLACLKENLPLEHEKGRATYKYNL